MDTIDRKYFFDNFPFRPLNQSQTDSINFLLNAFDLDEKMTCLRFYAYTLATVKHETAETYRPIREYMKGAGRYYGHIDPVTGQVYYGRGFSQVTLKENYIKFNDVLKRYASGYDLINNPDAALEPDIAYIILSEGMTNKKNSFSGHVLSDYFNDVITDWIHARKIVNVMDRAELIADYARKFYDALQFVSDAKDAAVNEVTPDPELVNAQLEMPVPIVESA